MKHFLAAPSSALPFTIACAAPRHVCTLEEAGLGSTYEPGRYRYADTSLCRSASLILVLLGSAYSVPLTAVGNLRTQEIVPNTEAPPF
jgi:hypothetical protein